MLRLILALAAVLIVAASLASRLSEVRAAGNKTGSNTSKTTISGYDLKGNKAARSTTIRKHIPKGVLNVRD